MNEHVKAMRDTHLSEMKNIMDKIDKSHGKEKSELLQEFKDMQSDLNDFENFSRGA